jgi:hypothetical protein
MIVVRRIGIVDALDPDLRLPGEDVSQELACSHGAAGHGTTSSALADFRF